MTEYERLKKLIEDTNALIAQDITTSDPEFVAWKTKVTHFIRDRFSEDSMEMTGFSKIRFSTLIWASRTDEEAHNDAVKACRKGLKKTKAILEVYLDETTNEKDNEPECFLTAKTMNNSKIFIVHGHDGELKESVARIIEKQGIEAIILSEQANTGKTIIEKFEKHSDVGCAICLFTADDVGNAKSATEPKPRARQNVVFEAGYFIGKLGRERIVILADHGIEIPSDLSGVVYTSTQNWQIELLKELHEMGYNVDTNKLFF